MKETQCWGGLVRPGLPWWKRALDLVLVLFLAPGIVLIGGLVALVIRSGSAGPVFFCQRRIGYRGREFTLFKFRTMKEHAETDSHRSHTRRLIQSKSRPMIKLDAGNDPRLIPLGAVLRATGLDELPQVLNVLRGDMSLVGPRPCLPYEYELYDDWQKRRFEAAPGLTGLWQVNGKNQTTFERMICLDIEYAQRMSFWLDLKIMLKTPVALWTQCREQRAAGREVSVCAPSRIIKSVQS